MSTANLEFTWWDRRLVSAAKFQRNASRVIDAVSPWVFAIPTGCIALILLSTLSRWRWYTGKGPQEYMALGVAACSLVVSLFPLVRWNHRFLWWLTVLSACLFCRELHVPGSDFGIYFALALLLGFAVRSRTALRPFIENRLLMTLLFGAFLTYFCSFTFDHAWWRFLPGWWDWHENMEETLETAGHLFVSCTVVTSYVIGVLNQRHSEGRRTIWGPRGQVSSRSTR